jgi:hypothetical protein
MCPMYCCNLPTVICTLPFIIPSYILNVLKRNFLISFSWAAITIISFFTDPLHTGITSRSSKSVEIYIITRNYCTYLSESQAMVVSSLNQCS